MHGIPENIQRALDNLSTLVRARKAMRPSLSDVIAPILALIEEEEENQRKHLEAWARSQLTARFGVEVGQLVESRTTGLPITGRIASVRINFRFTDVTAVPCLEVCLMSGKAAHVIILAEPSDIRPVQIERRLAIAA